MDRDSEGLLLLTNDGALAQKLTHPRHEVDKDYEVALNKEFNPADIARLIKGIFIPIETVTAPTNQSVTKSRAGSLPRATSESREPSGKTGAPSPVRHVRARATAVHPLGGRKLRITLQQGLKRQVRLMLYELGYEVETLRRVRMGPITLGRLLPGRWRELTPRELAALTGSGK